MILKHCGSCQQYFFGTNDYVYPSIRDIHLLTACRRLIEQECSLCAVERMKIERLNIAAGNCGAIGLEPQYLE
jgi:hypothetical protein